MCYRNLINYDMALDTTKTNGSLGEQVHGYLVSLGVETPTLQRLSDTQDREELIKSSMRSIMTEGLGLDLTDDSLKETPKRIAKMFLRELFWGLDYKNFPKVTTISNKMSYDNMLLERDIKVHSVCEHHFLPIVGKAFIAYIPANKVIGLSKLNRIVEFFSRRPQVQERLTEQIFHTLSLLLETNDVAVVIKAEHSCVKLRGVEDINSDTVTSRIGGAFMDGRTRMEFYSLINGR